MTSFRYGASGSGAGLSTYANAGDLPASSTDGALAVTLDTNSIYIYETGTGWVLLVSPSGSTSPGGASTNVQYNNAGVFAGSSGFTWNNGAATLNVSGIVRVGGGSAGAPSFSFNETDNDTGLFSTGDGNINFANNGVLGMTLDPSHNLMVVGSVTASSLSLPSAAQALFFATPQGSAGAPVFRAIGAAEIRSSNLAYPLVGPVQATPSYLFDSDTGWGSDGDGQQFWLNNSVETVRFEPGLLHFNVPAEFNASVTVNNSLTATGDISAVDGNFSGLLSAANYPPTITGSANTFAAYDNSGVLSSVPTWSWNNTTDGLNANAHTDPFVVGGTTAFNFFNDIVPTASSTNNSLAMNVINHFDNAHSGFDVGPLDGISTDVAHLGNGNTPSMRGLFVQVRAGEGTQTGTVDQMSAADMFLSVAAGDTLTNGRGCLLNFNNDGTVSGNYNMLEIGTGGSTPIGGNVNGLIINNTIPVGGSLQFISGGSGAAITGSVNVLYNNTGGGITGTYDGVDLSTYGAIGNNHQGFTSNCNATIGGTAQGIRIGYNAAITGNAEGLNMGFNTGTIGGNLTGLNLYSGATVTGNVQMGNFAFNGTAPSMRVMDVNLQGATVTGVQTPIGIQIEMDALVQTSFDGTNRPAAIQIGGGVISQQMAAKTISNHPYTLDLGNSIGVGLQVAAGTPITGTDFSGTQLNSGLDFQDDIGTSAFGIGWNANVILSQFGGAAGKTASKATMLSVIPLTLFTSAGGTVTEFNYFRAVSPVNAGFGTDAAITDLYVFRAENIFSPFSVRASKAHGIHLDDSGFFNYLGGKTRVGGSSYVEATVAMDVSGAVSASEGVVVATTDTQPAASAAVRGMFWVIQGGAGVADILQVCLKDAADVYNWVTLP